MPREKLPATARILLAMRNSSRRQAPEAIGEWVDNSFGEKRGNAQTVWITHQGKRLLILDDGRAPDKLGDTVQLGAGAVAGGYDTGRFGWGGSVAQLTMADRTEMWALRDGLVAHAVVPWTHLVEREDWPEADSAYEPGVCPPALAKLGHGFLMSMEIRRAKIIYSENVKKYLAREFAPALLSGRHLYWSDGKGWTEIEPWRPPQLHDPIFTTFEVVSEDTPGLWVELLAGWSDELPQDEMGLEIVYGPRRVGRTTRPMRGYRGPTIYGTLTLKGKGDWLGLLDSEKSGIASDEVMKGLEERARELLMPLMDNLRALVRNQALIEIGGDIAKALSVLASAGRAGSGDQPGFPDTSGWAIKGGRRNKRNGEARKRSFSTRTIHIDGASGIELSKAAWRAETPEDDDWQILLNEDIPSQKRALEEIPPDRPLIQNTLGAAIAVSLIAQDPLLLCKLRIYSDEEYQLLLLSVGGNHSALVPFVVARLLEAIDPSPKKKPA